MFKLFTLVFLLLLAPAAHAGMTDSEVSAWVHIPSSPFFGAGGDFSVKNFTIADGVEVAGFGVLGETNLDFSEGKISINFWRPSGRTLFENSSYEFAFLSPNVKIDSVILGSMTSSFEDLSGSMVSLSESRISHSTTAISLNLAGLAAPAGSQIELLVSLAPVPEPSQMTLLFLGISILAIVRRHRKASVDSAA